MKTSSNGKRLIAAFEGCVLHPYNDAGGNATIGVGHLIHYGNYTNADVARYHAYHGVHGRIRKARPFNLDDAYALLGLDLASFERDIAEYIHVKLTQNEYDALMDLTYNCGPGPLAGRLGELINARDWAAACNEILVWDHVNGEVNSNLQARREADVRLFRA